MRVKNWENILLQEIAAAKLSKFSWGNNDCTIWSFKVISKISDINILPYLRGLYTDKKSAIKLLKEKRLLYRVIEKIGAPRNNILETKRGDLVLENINTGEDTLGICIGKDVAFLGIDGLVFLPIDKCYTSWEI